MVLKIVPICQVGLLSISCLLLSIWCLSSTSKLLVKVGITWKENLIPVGIKIRPKLLTAKLDPCKGEKIVVAWSANVEGLLYRSAIINVGIPNGYSQPFKGIVKLAINGLGSLAADGLGITG